MDSRKHNKHNKISIIIQLSNYIYRYRTYSLWCVIMASYLSVENYIYITETDVDNWIVTCIVLPPLCFPLSKNLDRKMDTRSEWSKKYWGNLWFSQTKLKYSDTSETAKPTAGSALRVRDTRYRGMLGSSRRWILGRSGVVGAVRCLVKRGKFVVLGQ